MSGGTIRVRAAACQQLFAQCLSLTHVEHMAWFEMRRGEFNIWAYGLQALSSSKSSLDYRVRNRSDVRGIIMALLGGLSEDLEDCISIDRKLSSEATGDVASPELDEQGGEDFDFADFSDGEASSVSSASTTEEGPFSLQMYNIRTIIAQLTRFSSMIRRSGTKFRFKRADAALALRESEFDEFKEHLTSMVMIRSIKFDVGDPTSFEAFQDKMNPDLLTPVQKRLIHGNVLRRNRIIEATKNMRPAEHQAKDGLEKPTHDWKFVVPENKTPVPASMPQVKAAPSKAGGTVKSSAQSAVDSIARSATEIGSQLGLQLAPPKAAPSVMTKVTKIGINQDYPKCPKPISDDFIQCPYCADVLPAEYKNHSSRWRGHVAQDILPYMCIYEECPLADEMYLTSEELISHVREYHATTMWACNLCLPKTSNAELCVFESSAQWQEHMQQDHGGSVPVQQLSSLARVSERQVIQAVSCPLCAHTPLGIQTTVDQHILQHLHEFALRGLPPGVSHDIDGSISDSSINGLSTDTDLDDSDEEEPYHTVVLEERDIQILTRELYDITYDYHSIVDDTQHWFDLAHDFNLTTNKSERTKLQAKYSDAISRLQMMVRAADVSLPPWSTENKDLEHIRRHVIDPLQIELDILHDIRSGETPTSNELPIIPEFNLTVPRTRPSDFSRHDADVVDELETFAFEKQNGFIALLDGANDQPLLEVVSRFAWASQEKYFGLRFFLVDLDDAQFGQVKGIGDLDQAFGQIATELLEMHDLLDVLAHADRGSGLVEAVLEVANRKAKARWVVVINNLAVPVGDFLRDSTTDGDYLRLPKVAVQGSVIITSPEQPSLPEALDVHKISRKSEMPQRPYDGPNGDFEFDYILTRGEFSRLRLRPSSRSSPRRSSAERWRPILNLVHPTPPSSPGPESSVVPQNEIIIEYEEDFEPRDVSSRSQLYARAPWMSQASGKAPQPRIPVVFDDDDYGSYGIPHKVSSNRSPRQHFRPPPPSQRKSVGFDDVSSDSESDLFRNAPHGAAIDFLKELPIRKRRPSTTRRQNLGGEFPGEGYAIEPAEPKTRRSSRRSVSNSVEDKINEATRYQNAVASGAPAPLTVGNLRRLKNSTSSSSRAESSFQPSETTKTTMSGNNDDDITIKIPSDAVVEYGGAKINSAKGGEITFRRGGSGSDRDHSDELRSHAHRTERSGTRPRASSQSAHALRPRAIMSPNLHDHTADYPDNPTYYGVPPYAPYGYPYDDDEYDHVYDS